MSIYLYRLGRFSYQRRRLVLGIWLVILFGAIALARGSGGKTNDNFTVPGTESQRAVNLLKQKLPALSGGQTQVVFATKGATKVTDPVYQAGIEKAVANLKGTTQVALVIDPYQAKLVSPNRNVALGTVQYSGSSQMRV